MLEEGDLQMNLLEFRQKSFQFDHIVAVDSEEYAVFTRTETETESQLRPKLVHLRVYAPREWIAYDPELDLLRLVREGESLPPRIPKEAQESAAEPTQFKEQGFDWTRVSTGDHAFAYFPTDRAARFASVRFASL